MGVGKEFPRPTVGSVVNKPGQFLAELAAVDENKGGPVGQDAPPYIRRQGAKLRRPLLFLGPGRVVHPDVQPFDIPPRNHRHRARRIDRLGRIAFQPKAPHHVQMVHHGLFAEDLGQAGDVDDRGLAVH